MKQNEYRRLSSTHAPFLTVATDFVQLISDSEDWLRVSRDFINSLLNVFMECWTMMFRRLKDAVGDSNAVDKKRGSAAWREGDRGRSPSQLSASMVDMGN